VCNYKFGFAYWGSALSLAIVALSAIIQLKLFYKLFFSKGKFKNSTKVMVEEKEGIEKIPVTPPKDI